MINAKNRKEVGKGASRRLRMINKFPAIIYGNKINIPIELDQNVIINVCMKDGFYNDVLILILNEKKIKVMIQSVQLHPYKLKFMHIDFIHQL